MAKILLLGCGSLGLKLARRLIKEDHGVIAIKRSPLSESVVGLRVILTDITCAAEVTKIPTDIDQIVVLLTPSERNERAYETLYHDGLNNIFAHFFNIQHHPHWLFVSSASVYAQSSGEWVDEDSPAQATSFNGRSLRLAEQNLWAQSASNTVVRFSGIYGPGRESLVYRVREGVPVQYEPPYYTNRIHEEDCIGVLCFLIEQRLSGQPIENLYVATDSEPVSLGNVVLWLSKLIACLEPPANVASRDIRSSNKKCSNSRLLSLGYSFRYPSYKEGYEAFFNASR